MIKNILALLSYKDYYGISEVVEVAKGKHKTPETVIEACKQFKRALRWQQKKL